VIRNLERLRFIIADIPPEWARSFFSFLAHSLLKGNPMWKKIAIVEAVLILLTLGFIYSGYQAEQYAWAQAGITDQRAIAFTNQSVRTTAEKFRALKYEVDSILVVWNNGMNSLIPNTTAVLEDGRTATEGVNSLTGAQINAFMTVLTTYQTFMNQAGNELTVARPCVRTLEVTR